MNAARPSDGLLSAKQTIALLGLVRQYPLGRLGENLLRDLAALHPAVWSRGRNTISFLLTKGILTEHGGMITLVDSNLAHDKWFEVLGELVAGVLAKRLAEEGVGGCLQASGPDGLWLDAMQIPGTADGLPLWIIEFAVATREHIDSRFWRVAEVYETLFLAGARAANLRRVRRSISAADLEAKLDRDAINGQRAEEWVLAFERRRLATHPLVDQVRRISEENVAAGYDIVSFSSANTLHHDLFIEVKSYEGSKRFFWTRNEIATSEEYGESYSLYLIDRSQMNQVGYEPQVISGPYAALFQSSGSGWTISPTTFECVAPRPV